MVTEDQNPESRGMDQKSTSEILKVINDEDKKVALAVEKELPSIAKAVDIIVESLSNKGKIYLVGAGTSGRLGIIQQAEIPPTFNDKSFKAYIAGGKGSIFKSKEGSEDSKEDGYKILTKLKKADVVVGIAASGSTPYVIGALEKAIEVGCKTVGISCNPNSEIVNIVDVAITAVVGPEVISGSTRMKAGTAQKMILDMVSTASMVKMGKVYGNLMVDVMATNKKLKERAKSVVMKVGYVSYEKAGELLEISNYEVKPAVVMAKKGCNYEEAKSLLRANKNRLRPCLC